MSIVLADTQLHGSRSRDLERQSALDINTLFAVRRNVSAEYSAYDDLSSSIAVSALNLMKVGTMAFEEKWEYSPADHRHGNYTNVSADVRYSEGGDGIKLGTLSVGEEGTEGFKPGKYVVKDIFCPLIENPVPAEPEYGTLRFMYSTQGRPSINEEYISSDNFDGWVYPDGKTYDIVESQFTKRGNSFVTRDFNPFINGDKLVLPDLSGRFFKLNPFTEKEPADGASKCAFKAVASHSALPSHTHPISKLDAEVELSADMDKSSFKICSGCSGTPIEKYGHNGKGPELVGSPFKIKANINIGAVQLALQTKENENSGSIENWPDHLAMPVMIYVGGRKKEYEKVYLHGGLSDERMAIVTWNVHRCSNNGGIDGIRSVLRSLDADIYCLQEIDKNTARSGGKDQLEELRRYLGSGWKKYFVKAFDCDGGEYGIGILCKDDPQFSISYLIDPIVSSDEQRVLQILEFKQFIVVNTHLASAGDEEQRLKQIEFILSKLEQLGTSKPIWLCGDLNNTPDSSVIAKLKTKFTIVSETTGTTMPDENRIIDYIFVSTAYINRMEKTSRIAVEAGTASDHYPVKVEKRNLM